MKVFINHSWMDKTTADLLAKDLGDIAEVWLDIQQLHPGAETRPRGNAEAGAKGAREAATLPATREV